MTRVLLDRYAGFCAGVRRTIRGAREAVTEKRVVSYGELIHNPDVTRELKRDGISVCPRLEDIKLSDFVIIRAHGIPPDEENFLKNRGISYLDLTCLRVKQIHKRIKEKREQGYRIIIVGDPDHPEVKGHLGYAGEAGAVLSSVQEAEFFGPDSEKMFVFAQTTTSTALYHDIIRILSGRGLNPDTLNTLCPFVLKRQEWIGKYSQLTAASLVIGGKNSSNTKKLFEIAAQNGTACWICGPGELDLEKILDFSSIAVTAGASTPDESISAVLRNLEAAGAGIELH
ncbi:4-hydroxy-3-methylbut-2-enyl diphosphate reductase [subsurface metagenome]